MLEAWPGPASPVRTPQNLSHPFPLALRGSAAPTWGTPVLPRSGHQGEQEESLGQLPAGVLTIYPSSLS